MRESLQKYVLYFIGISKIYTFHISLRNTSKKNRSYFFHVFHWEIQDTASSVTQVEWIRCVRKQLYSTKATVAVLIVISAAGYWCSRQQTPPPTTKPWPNQKSTLSFATAGARTTEINEKPSPSPPILAIPTTTKTRRPTAMVSKSPSRAVVP